MTSRNNQNHMLTDHELHDLLKAEYELDMTAAAKDEMRSQSDRADPSDNSDDNPRNDLDGTVKLIGWRRKCGMVA